MSEYAARQWAATQNTLSTTAELIFAARPTRTRARIRNTNGTIAVFIGESDAVTSSTGWQLAALSEVDVFTTGAIYAIAASATPVVSLIEEYN